MKLLSLALALLACPVLAFVPGSPVTRRESAVGHAKTFSRRAVILKPTLIVQTSVDKTKEEADAFLIEASKAVASGLGKPESYVMVSHQRCNMRFGGTDEPVAFAYLASIGRIGPDTNPGVTASLTELIGKHFGVKPGRIFIQFVDSAASNFGWNGRTFG